MTVDEKDIFLPRDLSETSIDELLSDWKSLPKSSHEELFFNLDRPRAEELFEGIPSVDQAELLQAIPPANRKSWVRLLEPDDIADLIQNLPEEMQTSTLQLLDPPMRVEVTALMAYHEDQAGGLMNSRFARLRADMKVEEAIRYLRAQTTAQVETIYYAYVLDKTQKLLGVVSLRQLFRATPDQRVEDMMVHGDELVTVREEEDQEQIAQVFSANEFLALPVVDEDGRMKGIVTIDDIVQVVQEEATEDIQKFGGIEALDEPYFKIGFFKMIKKRAGWLLVLFIGEMFTATAMARYEDQISKAVVLALFIPLIISSGGNTGSQASTLIIRAMALGEVRLRDWWRVFVRETLSGLALGAILGGVGLLRVFFWPARATLYGAHYGLVSLTVGCSLIGVVLWGTLAGSMLPFVLRRVGFDPATASAPFVATLVDVTGIVIYFSVANMILGGFLM
jgi:magnesium transporter